MNKDALGLAAGHGRAAVRVDDAAEEEEAEAQRPDRHHRQQDESAQLQVVHSKRYLSNNMWSSWYEIRACLSSIRW